MRRRPWSVVLRLKTAMIISGRAAQRPDRGKLKSVTFTGSAPSFHGIRQQLTVIDVGLAGPERSNAMNVGKVGVVSAREPA